MVAAASERALARSREERTAGRHLWSPEAAESLLQELAQRMRAPVLATGEPMVGVDLGTAYIVVVAVDEAGAPLGGALRFAQVVRDGLVVDYLGAIRIVRDLVSEVEQGIGAPLRTAATAYPPGIPASEAAYVRHVVESAGLDVVVAVEEPVAANAVLGIRDGALVDVGGGTTGIAIFRDGRLVHVADEPTGGTHLSLVVAGALGISFEAAEERKRDPRHQAELLPVVRPVIEKIASIIARHVSGRDVGTVYLVGGTCAFCGFEGVIEKSLGIPTILPSHPLLVTPLGIALSTDPEGRRG